MVGNASTDPTRAVPVPSIEFEGNGTALADPSDQQGNHHAGRRFPKATRRDHDAAGTRLGSLRTHEMHGRSMVRKLSVARIHIPTPPQVLGERGHRSLLLPSVSQPRQPARSLGSIHPAAAAPSCHRSLSNTRSRRSLGSPLVIAVACPVACRKPPPLHHTEQKKRGHRYFRRLLPRERPSIISIDRASIILSTLKIRGPLFKFSEILD